MTVVLGVCHQHGRGAGLANSDGGVDGPGAMCTRRGRYVDHGGAKWKKGESPAVEVGDSNGEAQARRLSAYQCNITVGSVSAEPVVLFKLVQSLWQLYNAPQVNSFYERSFQPYHGCSATFKISSSYNPHSNSNSLQF